MMKLRVPVLYLFWVIVGLVSAPSVSSAGPEQDAAETARHLALLLAPGRVTVGANQALINDAEKGDKGFTPEVFEKQLVEKFKERSGVELTNLKSANVPEMAKKLLPQLVEASKRTVAENQSTINKKGVGFKCFIPATFGTQAAAKFSGMAGIYLKQTTHDGLLRNPANKADGFEADVLQKFADPAYPRQGEKIVSESADGGKTLRVMLPPFDGKGSHTCHGEPKGEKDISGYKKQGAKEGDLGGAISIKLRLKEF